jgi:hypothetical protein
VSSDAGRPVTAREGQEPAETETRLSPTARVEAFSDGVMAIAITLLVLDLKVPPADAIASGGLVEAVAKQWPAYVAYLAAFLTIGIIWLNHRTLVDRIARFDARLLWSFSSPATTRLMRAPSGAADRSVCRSISWRP